MPYKMTFDLVSGSRGGWGHVISGWSHVISGWSYAICTVYHPYCSTLRDEISGSPTRRGEGGSVQEIQAYFSQPQISTIMLDHMGLFTLEDRLVAMVTPCYVAHC